MSVPTSAAQAAANRQDWKWQQRNTLDTPHALATRFPGLATSAQFGNLAQNLGTRKLGLTPYLAGLIRTDARGCPLPDDPIWLQVVPVGPGEGDAAFAYDGQAENWELAEEMVTPICQHKYDNRVILRCANVCHAYCQFCYEALRTLETVSAKPGLKKSEWRQTLDYIGTHPQVEEVILSGGEPLMLSDTRLGELLGSLRQVCASLLLRLHTRALSFNPFRITDELVQLLASGGVHAVGLHIAHPREITEQFCDAVARLQSKVALLFANIPLLAGINDDYECMKALCMRLYGLGVLPHYLYQFMPFSPGAQRYRTPISTGVAIVSRMKRRLSNLAVPEYVVPHRNGKFSVPLGLNQPATQLTHDAEGNETLVFTNWQGRPCVYPE
ncbi:KamA family radical SAM protein [Pseudomonas typographi]|uniref:KamA family radical SAM protein n=1 Tax=Pseudomonas typographi TaxID=2715964 RepID=UPI00168710BD|nr:radical SAM protein [Pseudomonas typographi]MBD1587289.1 radical SAM protein [Pseudomonas typographi]